MPQTPSAPLLLALDTASPTVSVALARGPELLGERSIAMERSSALLLALVHEVLSEAGARPADLAGVVALRGPGSFTGVRIGLATVLGLHQALGMPATALETLRVLAMGPHPPNPPLPSPPLPPGEGGTPSQKPKKPRISGPGGGAPLPVGGGAMGEGSGVRIAVVDALRGDWSAQAFTADPFPSPLTEAVLIPGSEIPNLAAGPRIVTGFGVSRLAALPGWPADLPLVEAGPLAAAAVRLAADPDLVWDSSLLTAPLYSRPPAVTLPKARRAAVP
jgi:tRNA threonylcarbamoyl adenosine modification protein YeaZ